MKVEECSNYSNCDAPICPLDLHPEHIWYSDEQICSKRGLGLSWIRTQKRLAKIKAKGFFTQEMLVNIKRIGKKTKGIDPDSRASMTHQ